MSNNELLKRCLKDNIPIVRKQTSKLILSLIDKHKFNSFLEIGTAYGYSCSLWLESNQLQKIVSLEKNFGNYSIAKKYLNDERLELINIDAFEYHPKTKFDIIFLDGPKSHQEILVQKYLNYLNENGVMVIDNLYLKKFDKLALDKLSKNQLKLIQKINKFKLWLQQGIVGYKFKLYDIDDGVGVLVKNAK